MISDSNIEAYDELCARIMRINRFIDAANLHRQKELHLELYLHHKVGDKRHSFYLQIHSAGGAPVAVSGATLEQAAEKLLDEELFELWEQSMADVVDKQAELLGRLRTIFVQHKVD